MGLIAGERGAEIVGHINGRTEVLNRSQIASAIYSAVATAMSNYGSNSGDIRVYAEEGPISNDFKWLIYKLIYQ